MSPSRQRRRGVRQAERTGLPGGLLAVAGGALMIVGSFFGWLTTATQPGGRTSISGFGSISGDNPVAGGNLNDLLSTGGLGSFRPGLIGLIFGIVAMLAGVAVALSRPRGPHPFRVAACLILLAGVAGAGWGLYRGFAPGTGGILTDGSGAPGIGQWVTAAGGLLLLLVAGWLLAGRADAAVDGTAQRHRGIQPG